MEFWQTVGMAGLTFLFLTGIYTQLKNVKKGVHTRTEKPLENAITAVFDTIVVIFLLTVML